MKSEALKLASLFSYSPNQRGYCGRSSAGHVFFRCIRDGVCGDVSQELTHFIVLYPYLKTIASVTGLSPFDHKVVEAYWLGNDLLKKMPTEAYDILLDMFKQQGVPVWLIDSLRKKRPAKFIPTHLFQVLHVGVGQASGAVPFNLASVNNCMVRWGKVVSVTEKKIELNLSKLSKSQKSYQVIRTKEMVSAEAFPFFKPKVGDTVAMHWRHGVKILSREEEKDLMYWTKQVLKYTVADMPSKSRKIAV